MNKSDDIKDLAGALCKAHRAKWAEHQKMLITRFSNQSMLISALLFALLNSRLQIMV